MSNSINFDFRGTNIFIRRSAGSHIPVLRSISKHILIENVAELGTGIFSLKTFLDKAFFPDIKNIYSYETIESWIKFMKEKVKDKRWEIISIDQNVCSCKKMYDFAPFDLAFIDAENTHRKYVLTNMKDIAKIFVLHDCNIDVLSGITKNGFKYKYIYVPPKYNHTAILSDVIDVSKVKWNIKWEEDFIDWI